MTRKRNSRALWSIVFAWKDSILSSLILSCLSAKQTSAAHRLPGEGLGTTALVGCYLGCILIPKALFLLPLQARMLLPSICTASSPCSVAGHVLGVQLFTRPLGMD